MRKYSRLKMIVNIDHKINQNNGLTFTQITFKWVDKKNKKATLQKSIDVYPSQYGYTQMWDDMIDDAILLYEGSENLFIEKDIQNAT